MQQRENTERRLQRDRRRQPQCAVDRRCSGPRTNGVDAHAGSPARTAYRPSCDARTARSACCRTDCATTAPRRTAAPRMESARRRSPARCCRRARRAGLRPARRDKAARRSAASSSHAGDLQPRRCRRCRSVRQPAQRPDDGRRKSEAPAPDGWRADIAKPRPAAESPEATIHQPTAPCSAPRPKISHSRRFRSALKAPRQRNQRNGSR